jgi:hypothetical protein
MRIHRAAPAFTVFLVPDVLPPLEYRLTFELPDLFRSMRKTDIFTLMKVPLYVLELRINAKRFQGFSPAPEPEPEKILMEIQKPTQRKHRSYKDHDKCLPQDDEANNNIKHPDPETGKHTGFFLGRGKLFHPGGRERVMCFCFFQKYHEDVMNPIPMNL